MENRTGSHETPTRAAGDGKGWMSDEEWRTVWNRDIGPFVGPCCASFLLGGIVMAILIGAM